MKKQSDSSATSDAFTRLRLLKQSAATATRVLLRKQGWHYTCLNPARCWLWSRKLADGRTILTDLDTALAIEASLAGHPLPPTASAPQLHPALDTLNP